MSKNKIKFVDETILKPQIIVAIYSSWRRCNNMVLSWILRSLTPSIAQTALNFEIVKQLWKNLKERFSQSDVYRLADLQTEIFNISQGDRLVTDYFAALQVLWIEFTTLSPIRIC